MAGYAVLVVRRSLWSGLLCWRAIGFPVRALMPVPMSPSQKCGLLPEEKKRFDVPWRWVPATSTIRRLAFHGVYWPGCSLGAAWSHNMYNSVRGNAPRVSCLLRRALMLPKGARRCCACLMVHPPVLVPLSQPPGQAL